MDQQLDPPARQLAHHEVPRPATGPPRRLRLLCPGWRDPRNVGAAFRLADAAGVAELLLSDGSPRPPNAKLRRTARSTEGWVPWRAVPRATDWLRERRAAGDHIIGLEITDRSVPLFDYRPPAPAVPLVLVAGAEDRGIAPEVLALCHATVHLPMYGRNSSLNVTVALGAAVYGLLGREL